MSLLAALCVIGPACLAGWIAMEVQKRRTEREIDELAEWDEARARDRWGWESGQVRTPGAALAECDDRETCQEAPPALCLPRHRPGRITRRRSARRRLHRDLVLLLVLTAPDREDTP